MIQKVFIIAACTCLQLLFAGGRLSAQTAPGLYGRWQDTDHPEQLVDLYFSEGKWYGKAVSSNPSQQGKIVFRELCWDDRSGAFKGYVVRPENGESYRIEVFPEGDRQFRFSVGRFIFSKTFHFKRLYP